MFHIVVPCIDARFDLDTLFFLLFRKSNAAIRTMMLLFIPSPLLVLLEHASQRTCDHSESGASVN
jgi:hypothetical protein